MYTLGKLGEKKKTNQDLRTSAFHQQWLPDAHPHQLTLKKFFLAYILFIRLLGLWCWDLEATLPTLSRHSTAKLYPSPHLADFRKDFALVSSNYVWLWAHECGPWGWSCGITCYVGPGNCVLSSETGSQQVTLAGWNPPRSPDQSSAPGLSLALSGLVRWHSTSTRPASLKTCSIPGTVGWKGIPDLSDLLPQIYGMHTSALYTHYTHIWIFKICLRIYECVYNVF